MSNVRRDSPRLVHQAFEYSSREEFVAAMGRYLLAGHRRGDRLFAATSAANIAALREELGKTAAAVDFHEAGEWYRRPYRTLQAYRDYLDRHGDRRTVRVIGEPVWHGRSRAARREWARYEAALNVAFSSSPAWIVCPYDTSALPEEVLEHARRTHPETIRGGQAHPSEEFVPPSRFFESLFAGEAPAPEEAARIEVHGDDLRAVRRLVASEASAAGLARERIGDLVLAANELATNGLRHGRDPVLLSLWREGAELVCEVEDAGRGLSDPLTGCAPTPPDALSGRGLWIARLLCDSLDLVRSQAGFAVRLRLSL